MNRDEMPLPDDVAALLRSERDDGEAVPDEVRARVGRRLGVALGVGAATGIGGAAAGEAAGATGSAPALGLGATFGVKALLVVAVATALGAVVGIVLRSRAADPPRAVDAPATGATAGARPVAASEPPATAPTPPTVADAQPVVAPVVRHAASTRATRGDAGSSLGAEQALLDEAQRALAAGAAPRALAVLERHASRYPRGLLAEEREAMAVRALVATGRSDDARRRAASFAAAWPKSLFRGAVDAALSSP